MDHPYEVLFQSGGSVEHTTDMSLIGRVQRQRQGWEVLAEIYMPLVYRWSRLRGLQPSDAGDVVQSVFLKLFKNIDRFTKAERGDTFRGWLRTITDHAIADERKRYPMLQSLSDIRSPQLESADPPDDENGRLLEVLDSVRSRVNPQTWLIFVRTVMYSELPCEVAADMGLAQNAVRQARFRVVRLLRIEFGDALAG
jgi:RNA polymerase sigma-70 factor (ECF subfamily)